MTSDRDPADSDTHTLRWHENARGASWPIHVLERGPGTAAWSLQGVDWDNDGDLDLLVGGSTQIVVLENLGKGRYAGTVVRDAVDAVMAYQVRAIDVDRDGDLDIVASRNFAHPHILWFERNGHDLSERLILRVKGPTNSRYLAMEVGDVDNDGDVDLMYSNEGPIMFRRNDAKRR